MNFDIQDLILLTTIERSGSFSAAADLLYRTRSAITQHIKKLEDQVGFQIFDRSSYRPTLTPEGRFFLERGKPLLQGLDRLKADIQQIKEGWEAEFAIAIDDVFPTENLFFLIDEFHKVAPHVNLRISREVLNGCWDALLENRATLAIGASGEPPLDLLCDQTPLGTVEFVFAVAKDHPLTRFPTPITPEDLEAFPVIIISDTSQGILKRSSGFVSRQSKIIVPTMDAKVQAQLMGLGVGYLPLTRIKALLQAGELVQLSLSTHVKRKSYFKIAWQAHSKSSALQWFLKTLESSAVRKRILEGSISTNDKK